MVKSTFLYNAGIWGLSDHEELEVVQQSFLKRALHLPFATPKYSLRMETGSLPLTYDIWKSSWLLKKLANSDDESLLLNAYRELRKVSEAHPEKKISWCLQLEEILASVGLKHLYVRNSPAEIAESTSLVLRKFRQFLVQ